MKQFWMAVATFAAMTGANAAQEESAGAYYNVPLDVLQADGSATSGTGQLLTYSGDGGTTVAQLLAEASADTAGFVLRRETTPATAADIFGSLDSLVIPYRPMNRPRGVEKIAVDLLDEKGMAEGRKFRLVDAAGEPLKIQQLVYTATPAWTTTRPGTGEVTGTARVLPGGYVILPEVWATSQPQYNVSSYNYRLSLTDPESGTTMLNIGDRSYATGPEDSDKITVPFLNDWDTSASGMDVYTGRIIRDDDTPAAHAKFSVRAWQYNLGSPGINVGFSMYNQFTAGPEGQFLLAFRQPETTSTVTGGDVQLMVNEIGVSRDPFPLVAGRDNVIKTRKEIALQVVLLDEQGQPMDMRTTSPVGIFSSTKFRGMLFQDTVQRQTRQLEIADAESTYALAPVDVEVPGDIWVMSRGHLFGPEPVAENSDVVEMSPVIEEFTVTGKITDAKSDPVAAALVLAADQVTLSLLSGSGVLDYEALAAMQGTTFDETGAYLAETDESGRFEISGKSLAESATFYVSAPGYGTIAYNPIKRPGRGMLSDVKRLSGAHDAGTQAIARPATVTLEMKPSDEPETSETRTLARRPVLYVELKADALGVRPVGLEPSSLSPDAERVRAVQWIGSRVFTETNVTMSVPAETTFSLSIHRPYGGQTTENKPVEVVVDKTLAPGEVRDLGLVE